jgi:hypothetical protein
MFEEKKSNKSNKNKISKDSKNSSNFEDQLSRFKKNNLFNLLQNNNKEKDGDFSYNNKITTSHTNSKNNSYDYNQEFLKKQKQYLDNNDEDDENDRCNNNNYNFSKNKGTEEEKEKNENKTKTTGLFGNFGIQTDNDYTSFKSKNPSTDVNKYGLAVNISNYETKMAGVEESVFYKIDLYSKLSNKSWSVSHKYMDFFELNLIFEKYYVSPPYFISGSMLGTEGVSDVLHKKTILNQYIKEVCNRSDLMTSIYCVKFLKLENHYELLMSYYPKELYFFKDQLVLPISVSYFLEQANLLFIGCGKQYKTLFNNILDKVKGFSPFNFVGGGNKQLKLKKNTQVKGQFVIINVIKNFQNKYLFEPLYAKPLYTECSSMNFFKDKSCLTIGMYDGSVNIYKIFINETTPETQGNLVIEAGMFQAHLKPIVGTVVNFIN